jgi:MFS family permease
VAAAVLDLAPRRHPGRGALVNGLLPTLGLAVGAAVSGVLVQFVFAPRHTVFVLEAAAFVVAGVLIASLPEPRGPGGRISRASLRPRVGVPRAMLGVFLTSSLSIVGSWSFGGFHLSLGPSVVQEVTGSHNRLIGGASFALLCGVAATAVLLFRSWSADRLMAVGGFAMATGVGLTVLGVLLASLPVLFTAAAVTGVGFGPSFAGAFRAVAAAAPPERRGEVVAATYIVSYLALSVPAIIGGALATVWPLAPVTVGYGLVVMVVALTAGIAALSRLVSADSPVREGVAV